MGSRRLAAVLACAAVATTAGCSGIPSSSPVRVVRRVPQGEPEPVDPLVVRVAAPPGPNDAPETIVRGYLTAQSVPENYVIARRYLAPQVEWRHGAGAVIWTARRFGDVVRKGATATVPVTLDPVVGVVTAAGEFRPRTRPLTVTFRLRQVPNAGWRLAEAPDGVLVSREDVARSFHRATLYWPDPTRRLVPDPVFLSTAEHPVTATVRALLAGPRSWLAPAVRTAIPRGTELLEPPGVVDRVVTLNFSREVRRATEETLRTLVSQVVWTLTERTEVEAVRLLAEGEPIPVPGRPELRDHRRADWADVSPVPPTADRRLFFVAGGDVNALDEAGRLSQPLKGRDVESAAVNRAGTMLAAVTRRSGGRQQLLLVDLTGLQATRVALTADRITAPTWEPGGEAVWVVHTTAATQRVLAVPVGGGPNLTVGAPSLPSPVTALRLSPEGARAVVVAGPAAEAAAFLLRVQRNASGARTLTTPLRVVPSLRGVTAAAFDGATGLYLAARTSGRRLLYRVDVDGYALALQRDTGLPAAPVTALAVSPVAATATAGTLRDLVATSAGRLWRRTPRGEWAALRSRGTAATFAG